MKKEKNRSSPDGKQQQQKTKKTKKSSRGDGKKM